MPDRTPVVALVGLPNSGKSTLLNRLTGTKTAIVAKEAHTTRDLNYGEEVWDGMYIRFVDTGGLVPDPEDKIQKAVQVQSWTGVAQADLLVWVIDRKQDPDSISLQILQKIWKTNKPFIICINKVDDPNLDKDISEYAKMGGIGFVNISSNTGYNINVLLDEIVDHLTTKGFLKVVPAGFVQINNQKTKQRKKLPQTVKKYADGSYYVVRDEEGLYQSIIDDDGSSLDEQQMLMDEIADSNQISNVIVEYSEDILGKVGDDDISETVEANLELLYNLQEEGKKVYFYCQGGIELAESIKKDPKYSFFDGGVASDTLNTSKKEPTLLHHYFSLFGMTPKQTWYVSSARESIEIVSRIGAHACWYRNDTTNLTADWQAIDNKLKGIELPKILLLGKPNVGKSSLFNAMVGKEIQIVTDIPGTTLSVNDMAIERNVTVIETTNNIRNIVLDFWGVLFFEDTATRTRDLVIKYQLSEEVGSQLQTAFDQWVSNDRLGISQNDVLAQLKTLVSDDEFEPEEWGDYFTINTELVEQLEKLVEEYNLYYLTNISENEFEKCMEALPEDLFTDGIASYEVDLKKPDPEIYETLCEQCDILPEESLFIDDLPANIESAKNLGFSYQLYKQGLEVGRYIQEKLQTKEKVDLKKSYILLDTTGIRRPGQRTFGAESFATFRTIQAAHDADVVILVLDGSASISHQDQVVAGICKEAKKGLVVVVNKADEIDAEQRQKFVKDFSHKFEFLKVDKFLWVSALYPEIKGSSKLEEIWEAVDSSLANRERIIEQTELRRIFNYLMKQKPPNKLRNKKRAVVYDLVYTKNKPPTFELLVKDKTTIHWSYLRFLENLLRRNFDFAGTEIVVKISKVDRKKVVN